MECLFLNPNPNPNKMHEAKAQLGEEQEAKVQETMNQVF